MAEAALRANAHSVVLCHNHPGGAAFPSQQDLEMTARLVQTLSNLDIVLVDHVIVADNEALSLVECGLLQHETHNGCPVSRVADPGGELLVRKRMVKEKK